MLYSLISDSLYIPYGTHTERIHTVKNLQSGTKDMLMYEYEKFYLITDGRKWWSGGITTKDQVVAQYGPPEKIEPITVSPKKSPIVLSGIDCEVVRNSWNNFGRTDKELIPWYYKHRYWGLMKINDLGIFMADITYVDSRKNIIHRNLPVTDIVDNITEATELEWIEYMLAL